MDQESVKEGATAARAAEGEERVDEYSAGGADPNKQLESELAADAKAREEKNSAESDQAGSTTDPVTTTQDEDAKAISLGNGMSKTASVEADKSDSEAETVVLPEQAGDHHKTVKAIKLEEADTEGTAGSHSITHRNHTSSVPAATTADDESREKDSLHGSRRSSLKRKRGKDSPLPGTDHSNHHDNGEGRDSSALTSTTSSPAPQVHSSRSSQVRTDRSKSSPPSDDDDNNINDTIRKTDDDQKIRHPTTKRRSGHERKSSRASVKAGPDESAELGAHAQRKRETRSATHYDEQSQRSESPPSSSRVPVRARSSQATASHGTAKRRKPAPLNVDRRRKLSEELQGESVHAESDDSSSVHSHHRLSKMHSIEGHATSPAKISHKKNRDRSGRTLLARACAQGVEDAERWIRERPEDIDVPDNAGNTPLQMASLVGREDVVDLLLKAGCDTTCKNIDLDTPLIDAVENSHLEVVKLLLKAKVDPRQRNAKGQEPLELVDVDDDQGEEIKAALIQARRSSDTVRRQSEDHKSHGTREFDTPPALNVDASPIDGQRSPPPNGLSSRKGRSVRSQPTKDALLWVNPTPQRLREEAGKGNMEMVDHILKMRPEADTPSVMAAVKGGHHDVLGLMIALGSPDADPEPIRSSEFEPGYNTPILAAIGRGNLEVLQMLLDQGGFDPTRRAYKGMNYMELSKERRGPHWSLEHDMIERAYDQHKMFSRRPRGPSGTEESPRKRKTRLPPPSSSRRKSPEPSSSPHESRKARKVNSATQEESDVDVKHRSSYQGTAARPPSKGQEIQPVDKENPQHQRPGPTKTKHSDRRAEHESGANGHSRADNLKPKRKLLSGNDIRSDQEAKRRPNPTADVTSEPGSASASISKARKSFSSHDGARPLSKSEINPSMTKKASSEEPGMIREDAGKKRIRVSVSPQPGQLESGDGIKKKKKRQRVDSHGNAIDQSASIKIAEKPAGEVNMMPSPAPIDSPGHGAAPVAFMGMPVNGSNVESTPDIKQKAPLSTSKMNHGQVTAPASDGQTNGDKNGTSNDTTDSVKQEKDQETTTEFAAETASQEEKEAAEGKMKREADIARRQQQKLAEEEAEAKAMAEERQAAEEARVAKIQREEEQRRRRAEEERQRREEAERRRREREEREMLRRIKQQQDEERARLEALPNGLRRVAELSAEQARDRKEITKWFPLRTITTRDLRLDEDASVVIADEQWIANLQVAPILANQDLELSQYTAWTRHEATPSHVASLWRQLRNPMSVAIPSPFLSWSDAVAFDNATKPKFHALKVFWIKLADFLDIVPRHAHLSDMTFPTRAIMLQDPTLSSTPSKPATPTSASVSSSRFPDRSLENNHTLHNGSSSPIGHATGNDSVTMNGA